MNVKVQNALISGSVKAIPSKSFAHRICICDFLANNPICNKYDDFFSKDISATANCLMAIRKGKRELDCVESGSTLRFLLPLCSALGGEFSFFGQGRLLDRPNEELFCVLKNHNIQIEKKKDRIKLNGKLNGGEFKIRGDISSQYVSGLLMALPNLDEDSTIILSTPLSSEPYVNITIEVLKNYGIKIERIENGYFIKGNQKFNGSCKVEGDWSNMAFFLVLGATCGKVEVKDLNLYSLQGDKKIVQVLSDAGANLQIEDQKIVVEKSDLKGFTMNADDCPDLVPICAVLGANATGKTIIKNVQRLKIKESDRIESTMALLNAFKVKAECDGNDLIVYGTNPTCAKFDSFNDHRIAMAGAVLASSASGESEIINALAVQKSYPTFFDDMKSLGGKISGFF